MKPSLTKLCLSLAAVFVASSLVAGPMPTEKNVTPMAPVPECTWTGFYIGGNVGITEYYARITDQGDWYDIFTRDRDTGAFIGGGQIGYNYQWNDLVFGLEADASYSNAEVSKTYDYGYQRDDSSVDFLATFRGRVGIAMDNNKVLLYATGGGAYAHGNWESDYIYPNRPPNYYYNVYWTGEDWRWGWTGGAGLEYMLNCHWTVRGEALLTWLTEDTTLSRSQYSSYNNTYPFVFSDDLYTFRVGVNYKFGGFFGH